MKKHLIFFLISIFVFSSCVSAPVQKKETRTVKSQHERARSAFNELDDKPSMEEAPVEEIPEPVIVPKQTTRPKVVKKHPHLQNPK